MTGFDWIAALCAGVCLLSVGLVYFALGVFKDLAKEMARISGALESDDASVPQSIDMTPVEKAVLAGVVLGFVVALVLMLSAQSC